MSLAKLGAAVAGTTATAVAGGFGIKCAIDQQQPTTLVGEEGYSGTDNSKYGQKRASLLMSTTAERNKPFWEQRVKKLVEGSSFSLVAESYFKTNFETKLNDYKTNKMDETKLKAAVDELKSNCKSKYDETATALKTADKSKWEEFWRFCSVSGEVPSDLDNDLTSP
ncbi:hypothetical protein [Candidatus Mycoplasma haematohominis]|uniref:Uncharacterized protein n=1 Tax=Candidatus Mycoplasma haematohominis TaxID=1494318 RepID=A0A478FQG7_9MOLU|nr:hypothetical protein [Candidatus Mycoplasma haemohominis]GCE63798.1 hypothetical protein MHSWG343_08050 [Candidatus Mycoplasma haemohominis]